MGIQRCRGRERKQEGEKKEEKQGSSSYFHRRYLYVQRGLRRQLFTSVHGIQRPTAQEKGEGQPSRRGTVIYLP